MIQPGDLNLGQNWWTRGPGGWSDAGDASGPPAHVLQALFGGSGPFAGAPMGPGGLLPSIGTGPFGIRDLAPGYLQYDMERQQNAFNAAYGQQQDFFGQAADAFKSGAAELSRIGQSGLEEIRGLNQASLDAFNSNKEDVLGGARDRYLGNQASNVRAASGRLASEKARIQNDPNLTAAQKAQQLTEMSSAIGQTGYQAASSAFSEYQQLNTGLEASFAAQEQQLRGQQTGFIGQAYDRMGQLTATGASLEGQGMMQLGQLAGSMPQQLVSLFSGLSALEQFRQNTPFQSSYRIGSPYGTFTGSLSGYPGQQITGPSFWG